MPVCAWLDYLSASGGKQTRGSAAAEGGWKVFLGEEKRIAMDMLARPGDARFSILWLARAPGVYADARVNGL